MVPVVFPDSTALWLFSLAALALLAIPGPAVLYIVVQSAEHGRRTDPPQAGHAALRLGRRVRRPGRRRGAREAQLGRLVGLDLRLGRRNCLALAAVRDVAGHIDRAALADHRHLHLAGILKLV